MIAQQAWHTDFAGERVAFLPRIGLDAIVVDTECRLLGSGPDGALPEPFVRHGDRVSLAEVDGGPPLAALVAGTLARPIGWKTMARAGPAHVLVLVHDAIAGRSVVVATVVDRYRGQQVCPTCLRMAFGLSEREAELAVRLASGRSLGKVAKDLGICVATARTHLRHIFMKVGIESQNELVALVAGLAFGHCPGMCAGSAAKPVRLASSN